MKVVFARVPSPVGSLGAITVSANSIELGKLSSFGGPIAVEFTQPAMDIAFKITSYPPEPLHLSGDSSTVWLVEVMIDPSMMFKAESRARAGLQPSMFTSTHQVNSLEEAIDRAISSTRDHSGSSRRNIFLAAALAIVFGCIAALMNNWLLVAVSLFVIVTSVPLLIRRSQPNKVQWIQPPVLP